MHLSSMKYKIFYVIRHTNIKCDVLDKSICNISVCKLKVLGRSIIGANVQLDIVESGLNNIT